MKRCLLLILLLIGVVKSFASVSVIDEEALSEEKKAMSTYASQIKGVIFSLANTSKSTAQLLDLKRLIKLQDDLSKACNTACSKEEMKKVKNYLTNLNNSISSQFKNYANVLEDINNLQGLENYINTFAGDTKEISLALQKAAQQEQHQINATLLQIQALLTLNNEQHQIEMKIEKQKVDDIYRGMGSTGL